MEAWIAWIRAVIWSQLELLRAGSVNWDSVSTLMQNENSVLAAAGSCSVPRYSTL